VRNVASSLKVDCLRYAPLAEEVKTNFSTAGDQSIEEVIDAIRRDEDLRSKFSEALSGEHTNENLHFLVKSMLDPRGESDEYSLFKPVGKSTSWKLVDPDTEWVATMASLAASGPGKSTTLREFRSSLRKLGLQPSKREVLSHLERAGLARGAHDADEAVRIRSAY
jgi:hypothetical protein